MSNYAIYNEGGLILRTGSAPDTMINLQAQPGEFVLITDAGEDSYVFEGVIHKYTEAELVSKNNLPTGWIWKMPERVAVDTRDLQAAKERAWTRIKTARAAAELADFTHNGNVYQADRERITGAVTAAILAQLSGAPYSIVWTLSNNTTVTLDGPQMMGVGAALAQHIKDVFDTGVARRAAIAAATTNAGVDAIQW